MFVAGTSFAKRPLQQTLPCQSNSIFVHMREALVPLRALHLRLFCAPNALGGSEILRDASSISTNSKDDTMNPVGKRVHPKTAPCGSQFMEIHVHCAIRHARE